jgi:hypothetical protein
MLLRRFIVVTHVKWLWCSAVQDCTLTKAGQGNSYQLYPIDYFSVLVL